MVVTAVGVETQMAVLLTLMSQSYVYVAVNFTNKQNILARTKNH